MLVTWQYRIRHSLMETFDPRARWIFSLDIPGFHLTLLGCPFSGRIFRPGLYLVCLSPGFF